MVAGIVEERLLDTLALWRTLSTSTGTPLAMCIGTTVQNT